MNLTLLRQARTAAHIGKGIINRKHLRAEFRDEAQHMFQSLDDFTARLQRASVGAAGSYSAFEAGLLGIAASLSAVTPVRFCLRVYTAQLKAILTALQSDWCREADLQKIFPDGERVRVLAELQKLHRWAHKAGLWRESAFYPRDKSHVDLKDTVPYLLPKRYKRQ
jgi:hypothetical protein